MDAGSAHVTGDRDIVVEFTDKVGKVTREVMEDREDVEILCAAKRSGGTVDRIVNTKHGRSTKKSVKN